MAKAPKPPKPPKAPPRAPKSRPAPAKRPRGRPTLYTEALAKRMLGKLAQGVPLAAICREPGTPEVRTVSLWKVDHPEFAAAFVRARDDGYDALAAQTLAIADAPLMGVETITKGVGKEKSVEVRKSDMLGHRKLQIETRLRLLAKWDPTRYGDRIDPYRRDPEPGDHEERIVIEGGLPTSAPPAISTAIDAPDET